MDKLSEIKKNLLFNKIKYVDICSMYIDIIYNIINIYIGIYYNISEKYDEMKKYYKMAIDKCNTNAM